MKQQTYGLHLMLRISEISNIENLDNAEKIATFLKTMVKNVGMRILSGPLMGREEGVEMDKYGYSGVVILAESHASIHAYPLMQEAFIDIFSCRPYDVSIIHKTIESFFGSYEIKEQNMLDRGIHWGNNVEKELDQWVKTR